MRRHWAFLVLSLWLISPQAFAALAGPLTYQSAFLRVEFSKDQPAFVALAVDSLGKGKLSVNPLLPPAVAPRPFEVRRYGQRVEYRLSGAPPSRPPVWVFETSARQMSIQSSYEIFQLSPRFRTLANNAASDACAITVYEYGEVALHTPPLAQGLTALDLLRQTLDRYLHRMKGCGMSR